MASEFPSADFDRWLTTDPENQPGPPVDEYDPPCADCGFVASDHIEVEDSRGFVKVVCPTLDVP